MSAKAIGSRSGDLDHAAVDAVVAAERLALGGGAVVEIDDDIAVRSAGDVPGGEDVAVLRDDDAATRDGEPTRTDTTAGDDLSTSLATWSLNRLEFVDPARVFLEKASGSFSVVNGWTPGL